jgi:hypothetical protein
MSISSEPSELSSPDEATSSSSLSTSPSLATPKQTPSPRPISNAVQHDDQMPTPTQTLPRFTFEPTSKPQLHDTSNTPLLFTDLSRSSAKPPTRILHPPTFTFQTSKQPTITPESSMGSIHIPREHAASTPRTGAVDPPDTTLIDSFQWRTPSQSHSSTPDRTLQTDIVPTMEGLQLKNSWDSSMWSSNSSNLFSDSQRSLGDSQASRRSSQATMKRDPLRRNCRNREHIYDKVVSHHLICGL